MTPYTAQELFTKVATHLLTQRAKSLYPEEARACAYRGIGGLKCALGCLIRDKDYSPEFEGRSPSFTVDSDFDASVKKQLAWACGLTPDTIFLAKTLQRLHDSDAPAVWEQKLRNIAKDYSLEMPS